MAATGVPEGREGAGGAGEGREREEEVVCCDGGEGVRGGFEDGGVDGAGRD